MVTQTLARSPTRARSREACEWMAWGRAYSFGRRRDRQERRQEPGPPAAGGALRSGRCKLTCFSSVQNYARGCCQSTSGPKSCLGAKGSGTRGGSLGLPQGLSPQGSAGSTLASGESQGGLRYGQHSSTRGSSVSADQDSHLRLKPSRLPLSKSIAGGAVCTGGMDRADCSG